MVALSLFQAHQAGQAEDAQVAEQNRVAALNEQMQLEQLERQGQQLHDEQINIALADKESAEDLADAKFDVTVSANEELSSIKSMAFENMGGTGGSVDSIVANARRGMQGNLNDMERNFVRGSKQRTKDIDKLEVEKKNRWYETKSNILNLSRSGKTSSSARFGQYVTSGVSGYGRGKSITRQAKA
jgi:hypothetical protein